MRSEDAGMPWLIAVMGEHFGRVLLADTTLFDQTIEVPVIWKDGL